MDFRIFAAPMQGFTDAPFCHFHTEVYGQGIDAWFSPFIRVEKGEVRRRDIKNITSSLNWNHTLIPQVIFRDEAEFGILCNGVAGAGFERMDLNLGCPFPPQVRHGRGSALLRKPELLDAVAGMADGLALSVKMRLGVERPDEWMGIADTLNRMKLSHVTVHPRVASQQYGGEMYIDEFAAIYERISHPVVFNGDIISPQGIDAVTSRFPRLAGVMIGRGLLARPSLVAEWAEGREWGHEERVVKIRSLHEGIYGYYCDTLCGATQILAKIKPFWEYLEPEIGRKHAKAIKKASSLAKYEEAVSNIM